MRDGRPPARGLAGDLRPRDARLAVRRRVRREPVRRARHAPAAAGRGRRAAHTGQPLGPAAPARRHAGLGPRLHVAPPGADGREPRAGHGRPAPQRLRGGRLQRAQHPGGQRHPRDVGGLRLDAGPEPALGAAVPVRGRARGVHRARAAGRRHPAHAAAGELGPVRARGAHLPARHGGRAPVRRRVARRGREAAAPPAGATGSVRLRGRPAAAPSADGDAVRAAARGDPGALHARVRPRGGGSGRAADRPGMARRARPVRRGPADVPRRRAPRVSAAPRHLPVVRAERAGCGPRRARDRWFDGGCAARS